MRIINLTKWKTEHLRAIAWVVAREYLSPNQRKRLTLTFKRSNKWVRGRAYVGNVHCTKEPLKAFIWLPNRYSASHPENRSYTIDNRYAPSPGASPLRASLAMVIAHEMSHTAGRRGERSMRSNRSQLGWASVHRGDWDWAESMPLEFNEKA